jgi:predicted dehydrogenase
LPTWDEAHLGNRRIGARSSRWRVDRSHPGPAGASGLRDQRCVHDPAGFCRRSRKDCGVPLASCDTEKLAQHPDVDLVTVRVKVTDHYLPVVAAIEAGQHVYYEWPLGRNTTKPLECSPPAERKGVGHAIGSKARCLRRSTTPRT